MNSEPPTPTIEPQIISLETCKINYLSLETLSLQGPEDQEDGLLEEGGGTGVYA